MEDVELGVCNGQLFPGDRDRAALLLPGARYLPAAPLLWFTREVLKAQGWTVLQVWDEWDRSVEADQWVADRFRAGVDHLGFQARQLVVAKSLTTLALPAAVEMALPGIWLTPLLGDEAVRSALGEIAAPTLVVGGTGDPTWDSRFVAELSTVEVVEVEGADHALQHSADPLKSIETLKIVTGRVGEFVEQLGSTT